MFIITADQADFATATKFINALRYVGVEVQQATAPLTAGGKTYPAGSFVVKSAQAGRAHVLDMFEPQDHPNDMDERGIPRRPYDNAGWTLAYQMGVKFDRVFDDVSGAFKNVEGLAAPLPGKIAGTGTGAYLLSPAVNDSFTIVNRLLKANVDVYRVSLPAPERGLRSPGGSFLVPVSAASTPIVQKGVQELGVNVETTTFLDTHDKLSVPRIALWDTTTGSMPSGWTRWLLERFEFPFTIVCGAGFDDTNLRAKYDVIILPSGASFRGGGGFGGRGGGGGGGGDEPAPVPGAGPKQDPDLRSLCQVTTGTGSGGGAEPTSRSSFRTAACSSAPAARPAASPICSRCRSPTTWSSASRRRKIVRSAPISSTCPARCCASRSIRGRRRPPAPRITSTCSSTTTRCSACHPMRKRTACGR